MSTPSGSIRPFVGQQVGDARRRLSTAGFAGCGGDVGTFGDRRIEQAVRVVEGRTEQLAARQVLERRRDAPFDSHLACLDRPAEAEARQRGAIGAHQKDRLDQIAARLHDSERCKFLVVERAFAHGAINREAELLDDLVEPQRRHAAVATTPVGEQRRVGVGDGGFRRL